MSTKFADFLAGLELIEVTLLLEREARAHPPQCGLRFIEDQQHAALRAFALELGEIPLG